jgi:hypothetical protein
VIDRYRRCRNHQRGQRARTRGREVGTQEQCAPGEHAGGHRRDQVCCQRAAQLDRGRNQQRKPQRVLARERALRWPRHEAIRRFDQRVCAPRRAKRELGRNEQIAGRPLVAGGDIRTRVRSPWRKRVVANGQTNDERHEERGGDPPMEVLAWWQARNYSIRPVRSPVRLSVVIPCCNERATIREIVSRFLSVEL